ncbi:MAG TPA: hypothetical protein VF898_12500 [Chloroflexota bacterium]
MRRYGRRPGIGPALFGATGWLFADLFIVLAMGFLVANTVGYVPPPSARAAATPTSTPTATPTPPRALDLHPITITLQVHPSALLADNPNEIAQIEQQLRQAPGLAGRNAGLVLAFGGALGAGTAQAIKIAEKVDTDVLPDLGRKDFVFQTTVYREFFNLDNPLSIVIIDVYVFKQ